MLVVIEGNAVCDNLWGRLPINSQYKLMWLLTCLSRGIFCVLFIIRGIGGKVVGSVMNKEWNSLTLGLSLFSGRELWYPRFKRG